jgi:hypothetical protein
MRWRTFLSFGLISIVPAAALAAGLRHGPPPSTPPDPIVPLGPIEIAAPPAVTPPVAAPPLDLELPAPAAAAGRAVPEWLGVSAIGAAATAQPTIAHFPVLEMFDVLRAHGASIVIDNGVVPEPSTSLLLLLGLSGLALRRR